MLIPKSKDKKLHLWKQYLKEKRKKEKTIKKDINFLIVKKLPPQKLAKKRKNTMTSYKNIKRVYNYNKLSTVEIIVFYRLGLLNNRKQYFDYLRKLLKDNETEKTKIKNIEKMLGFKLS